MVNFFEKKENEENQNNKVGKKDLISDQLKNRLELIRAPKLKKQLLEVYEKIQNKILNLPASTKFHHNWKGGLYDHVIEVIDFALKLYDAIVKNNDNGGGESNRKYYDFNRDDIIFLAFVHDLDKLDKYIKNPLSNNSQPFIYNKKRISVNDTAMVVQILAEFDVKFSNKHLNALTFSHGGWSVDRGIMEPLATIIHCADILSLNFGAKNEKETDRFKEILEKKD